MSLVLSYSVREGPPSKMNTQHNTRVSSSKCAWMGEEDSSTSWRAAQTDLEMISRATCDTVLGSISNRFVTMHPKILCGGHIRLS